MAQHGAANLQDHRVNHEPSPSLNVGDKHNTQQNMRQTSNREAFPHDKQDLSSMEDLIYNIAKQQRHLNDAQRRIQDWVTVMPGLAKNNMAPATTQKTEKCGCKNCKEERKRERRSAGKEKKHRSKQEEEKKTRRKSRR